MKKQKTIAITLLALIALMIMPFVFAQAPTDQFSIAVDDDSPVSDVVLATDVSATLDNAEDLFLFNEIDATEIEDDAVLAIYNNEAIIVLGYDAPAELAAFIIDVGYYLDDLDINHITILSNEVTSSNLRDLFDEDPGIIVGKPCPCGNYGDVDDDGLVTQLDVSMVADMAAGTIELISSSQLERADVTGNGEITGTDASKIARYLNGEIDTFPVCEDTGCIIEGDLATGPLAPEYMTYCCEDLEPLYLGLTNEAGEVMVGSPSVCYDPAKGVPECDYEGTEKEGYFYPNGNLLLIRECDNEDNNIVGSGTTMTDENSNSNSLQAKNQKGNIGQPILTKKRIMAQEMNEKGFSQEIRPLYNYNGAQTRFLQLHKALVKAIVGQKEIISYIGDEYPEADVTGLLDLNYGLTEVYNEVKAIDIESHEQEELTEMYVNFKGDAQELIALFKEEAHTILGDDDVIQLREQVRNINTKEMKTMSRNINQYKLKYNAEQVRETLEKVGIDDANLVNAVETGAITYGQIRSEIANRYNDLAQDVKKQVILKMKEAKVKAKVKSQKMVQSMNLGNGSEIAKQVRNRIATSNQNSKGKGVT